MSRYHSYLATAARILSSYSGEEPFGLFVRKFFAGQKKYGSTDRKTITHLCYCYFRTAFLFEGDIPEEKILKGLFLCLDRPVELLQELRPDWNKSAGASPAEKLVLLHSSKSTRELFPWVSELSEGMDAELFAGSFLTQPDLFLRIRPGHQQDVLGKLTTAGIPFRVTNEICVTLPNSVKVDGVIELNREAVVQDHSSQRIGEFLQLIKRPGDILLKVWDCCAASGGKSILAKDILGDMELTVSDVRENILANLKKRFETAGIKNYRSFLADLTNDSRPDSYRVPAPGFDLIIADVPCTGSGTWSRTPEQLFYFDKKKIGHYSGLQQTITSNVISRLRPGGHLLYITCSVFRKENEEAVELLKEKHQLEIIKMGLLKGYDKKADTLFAALLRLPLQAD